MPGCLHPNICDQIVNFVMAEEALKNFLKSNSTVLSVLTPTVTPKLL